MNDYEKREHRGPRGPRLDSSNCYELVFFFFVGVLKCVSWLGIALKNYQNLYRRSGNRSAKLIPKVNNFQFCTLHANGTRSRRRQQTRYPQNQPNTTTRHGSTIRTVPPTPPPPKNHDTNHQQRRNSTFSVLLHQKNLRILPDSPWGKLSRVQPACSPEKRDPFDISSTATD